MRMKHKYLAYLTEFVLQPENINMKCVGILAENRFHIVYQGSILCIVS